MAQLQGCERAWGSPLSLNAKKFKWFLSPATKLGQGNVFTGTCDSVHGGCYPSMHCRWYPSIPCSRSLGGIVLGGGWSRGVCSGGVAFCYGLVLWSSVMPFCYGLLVWWPSDWRWPSGMVFGGREGPEGHNRRPPHQKVTTPEGHHTRRPPGVPGGDPPPDGYCCGRYASYCILVIIAIKVWVSMY